MKYAYIDLHRSEFGVAKMCRLFDVSRSAYYAWKKRPKSIRQQENERLLSEIKQIYQMSRGLYGSPRITAELREKGFNYGHNRIARLMHQNKIQAKTRKKFRVTTNSRHKLPVAPNILERRFCADSKDQIWLSDITYIRTHQGWLYLAAVLDVYSRSVVGWSMSSHLSQELVLNALKQAIGRRNPEKGIIFHSDRGVQYASHSVKELLNTHKFRQSMCGKGNCYDNAMMESFFGTLKTECVYLENYQSRYQAKLNIFDYIEVYYNRIRKHSALGYLSPIVFENKRKLT